LLDEINACGADPVARLKKFATMTDDEIETVMTLQVNILLILFAFMWNIYFKECVLNIGCGVY
jgi:hypothetical protein